MLLSEGSWLGKSMLYEAKHLEFFTHLWWTCQHCIAALQRFCLRRIGVFKKDLEREKSSKLNKQTNKQSNKETNIFDTKWGGMNFPSRRPNHSLRVLQEPSLLKFCHRFLWLLRQPFPILPPSNNDAFFPNFEPTKSTPMGGGAGGGELAQPDGGYSTLAYTGASTPKGTFSPSQYA